MISQTTKLPTERAFGFLFATVFAGLGIYGYYKGWDSVAIFATLASSVVLMLTTFFAPKALAPFNRAWFHLGQLLGKIVSPIVLGIIFFGLLTPIALVSRLFGRDELKLKPRTVASYWMERTPPGPAPDSFKNQF